jgi:tetratricopeptide (TPR) repeat protein
MKRFLSGLLFFFLPFVTAIFIAAQQPSSRSPVTSSPAPQQSQSPSTTPVIPMNPGQQAPSSSISPVNPATPTPPASSDKDAPQAGPAHSPTPPDYSQEAYVVEHYHQSFRFENDGTGHDQLDVQVRITGESGVQALGQLRFGYSALSDKPEIAYVRVHKPDGTVITAQDSAVQDLTFSDAPVYSDYHEKHISVPSLRPGDTLEYRFIRNIVNPLCPGQFWTSYNFAENGVVLDEQLDINVPKARQIKLKSQSGSEPKITEDGDRRIYHWSHSHLEDKDESPTKKKKKRTAPEDEPPSVQLTTFDSWEQFGAWYRSLERDRRIPNDAVKAEAAQLIQGKSDDMAKVKALYDYVSRDFRYVSLSFGLGRFQPHAANEVLGNGYGDCKDKNTLLAALLQADGFTSTSVLIGSQHKLDPDIPAPSQFDHVITRVPVDGQEIWLDSTNGVAPFRMLAAGLRDKQALAIPPEGNAVLVRTPAIPPFPLSDHGQVTASITDIGTLKAHLTGTFRSDTELILRFRLRQIPGNHWKDFFNIVLQNGGLSGGDISNLNVSDPSDPENPLKFDLDVIANNYFDWAAPESKMKPPLMRITLPAEDDDDDSDAKAPSKPIKLGPPMETRLEEHLTIPPKYDAHAPIAVDVRRDYAEYHSTYKVEKGQLTASRSLKILRSELPDERREDYAAFRRAVAADQAQEITLENKAPGTTGVASQQSAEELHDAGIEALKNRNYDLAIQLFQRVVELEPKHKYAWNNLGRAYRGSGHTEKAIKAFQKQIEINPYDQYAYNNLGSAYEEQERYEDAAKQYQKQIEINPLDQYAHANLGSLYLRQKKYADATPELEKAADIESNNPLLRISLGQAYIATGQTDKGMAAFEKAISISPSPLIWNNIAYALSEQNVQLERAAQYADAAINAVETQLRDVKLDNLRVQDLGTTQLLFALWDTKGWVEFKRGTLDVSQQYILAAWLAGGTGDEAEHLGEISETEGKRDKAVQYYIASLAGEHPSTDARNRLNAMGMPKDLDHRLQQARDDFQKQSTISLNKSDRGTAEFYLLLSPGKVEQVKFIKGDDNLKSFADLLQKTDLGMKFPPDTHSHVVRRAIVRCGTTNAGACTLELVPSSLVRSLE